MRTKLQRLGIAAIVVGVLGYLTILSANTLSNNDTNTPVADPTQLSVRDECQIALGYSGRTNADKTWLNQCVHALTSPTPKPTTTTSIPPTATPSPTTTISQTPSTTPTVTTSPSQSPSPSTTPTPTGTPTTNCIAVPHFCGFPDATNTGPVGTLTVFNGDITVSVSGTIIQDEDIRGCILITASNVTIKNSKVSCTGNYVIDISSNFPNASATIQDTTVNCSTNWGGTAIGEHHMTVRRVNVTGCTNGFDIDSNADIQDSWCHDLTDEVQHPEAHTDCVQGDQTANELYQHNTFTSSLPYSTSAIGGGPGGTNWVINNNLLDGGAYAVYCPSGKTGSVTNNRFGRQGWNYLQDGAPPTTGCNASSFQWSNNVLDTTGEQIQAT